MKIETQICKRDKYVRLLGGGRYSSSIANAKYVYTYTLSKMFITSPIKLDKVWSKMMVHPKLSTGFC